MQKRPLAEFLDLEKTIEESLQLKPPLSISEHCYTWSTIDKVKEGHEKADKLRAMLKEHDRGYAQVLVHNEFVRALIPLIYRDCLDNNEVEIMRYNKIAELSTVSTIYGFRRLGKSKALVIILACVFQLIPNLTVLIFANNKEATGKDRGIAGQLEEMLIKFYGFDKKKFNKDNANIMEFIYSNDDVRRVYSFAASNNK